MIQKSSIRKLNSGQHYDELKQIEQCRSIVKRVRGTSLKSVVYGVNFICIDTSLLDTDLSDDPRLRRDLERFGTVTSMGNSGAVYLEIPRVSAISLWVWGLGYVAYALLNVYLWNIFSESLYEYISIAYLLYEMRA